MIILNVLLLKGRFPKDFRQPPLSLNYLAKVLNYFQPYYLFWSYLTEILSCLLPPEQRVS